MARVICWVLRMLLMRRLMSRIDCPAIVHHLFSPGVPLRADLPRQADDHGLLPHYCPPVKRSLKVLTAARISSSSCFLTFFVSRTSAKLPGCSLRAYSR